MYKIEFAGGNTVHLEVYLGTLDASEAWVLIVEFEPGDGTVQTVSGLWLGFAHVTAGPVPVMTLDVGTDVPMLIRLDLVRSVSL